MSKRKLGLAKAIALFKDGKETRNLRLTEDEIVDFIKTQIDLKESEIKELRKTFEQTKEEKSEDFNDSLLELDEDFISSRAERKATAKNYVGSAIKRMVTLKKSLDQYTTDIENLEKEITLLGDLRTTLEGLSVEE